MASVELASPEDFLSEQFRAMAVRDIGILLGFLQIGEGVRP